jgi:hypothetical protein
VDETRAFFMDTFVHDPVPSELTRSDYPIFVRKNHTSIRQESRCCSLLWPRAVCAVPCRVGRRPTRWSQLTPPSHFGLNCFVSHRMVAWVWRETKAPVESLVWLQIKNLHSWLPGEEDRNRTLGSRERCVKWRTLNQNSAKWYDFFGTPNYHYTLEFIAFPELIYWDWSCPHNTFLTSIYSEATPKQKKPYATGSDRGDRGSAPCLDTCFLTFKFTLFHSKIHQLFSLEPSLPHCIFKNNP